MNRRPYRLVLATASLPLLALLGVACGLVELGEPTLEERYQAECVRKHFTNLERYKEDGDSCNNVGSRREGCEGNFASECINYCGHFFCQSGECETDQECQELWGANFECKDEVVDGIKRGVFCDRSDCPKGTAGCPCRDDGSCGSDPFGSGEMACEGGTCESACPSACRLTSTCCGGAFCSGECIGTPCC